MRLGHLVAGLAVLVLGATAASASAAPGGRDPSFNGTGLVDVWGMAQTFVTPVARAATVQPDGKIVIVGQQSDPMTGNYDFAIVRLNPNGSYDQSFGSGGMVRLSMGSVADQADAVQLLPDGSVIVAGQTAAGAGVLKLTAAGAPAGTFGTGGKVIVPGTSFLRLTISNGRPVLLALDSAGRGELVRLTPTGMLDASFGGTGIVPAQFHPGSGEDEAQTGLMAGPAGSVIVGGYDSPGSIGDHFALERFTDSGGRDSGFGTGGIVDINEGTPGPGSDLPINTISDLAAAPDGSILAWGNIFWQATTISGGQQRTGAVAHAGTGHLLVHFSASGGQISSTLVPDPSDIDSAARLAVAPDGSVFGLLSPSGSGIPGAVPNYASFVVRFSSPSAIDTTFGTNGLASANFGTNENPATGPADAPLNVAVQPNGQPIIVGIDGNKLPVKPRGEAMRLLIAAKPIITPGAGTATVGHLSVSGTTVSAGIACTSPTGSSCQAKLTLSAVETLKGSKVTAVQAAKHKPKTRKRTVVFATTTVKLSAGQSTTAHLSLSGAGKRLLASRHKLPVALTILQSGGRHSTQTVTFKAPAKRKRKHG